MLKLAPQTYSFWHLINWKNKTATSQIIMPQEGADDLPQSYF